MIEQTAAAPPEIEGAAALPGQLDDALGALGAAAIDGLSEADLLHVITALEATKGAAAALQARASARFVEDRDALTAAAVVQEEISRRDASGRRSATRAEVALSRRCSPWQADRHVGEAKALVHDLPMTMSALTAGEISESRALIVVRETACLSRADRIEADRRLAQDLTTLGDRALTAAAQRVSIDIDQEAIVERRRRAAASRHVGVRPAPDGMARLSILGPLAEVVGAYAALTAAEQARYVATGDPEVDAARAADERGRGAWLADTALERLSGREEGEVQPVEVGLVMREDAVVPRPDACADGRPGGADGSGGTGGSGGTDELDDEVEIPGWGAVPGDMAREHLLRLCDTGTETWLRRLWTTPGGRDLVAMDSRRRLFSGALRQLIGLRDATCRVPWCDAPARQIDHVTPFARGGGTSAVNAMGSCQRHNLVKEEPGWHTEVISTGLDPGGGRPHEVRLTTPTGSEFTSVAAPLLGHGRASGGHDRSRLEIYYEGLHAA